MRKLTPEAQQLALTGIPRLQARVVTVTLASRFLDYYNSLFPQYSVISELLQQRLIVARNVIRYPDTKLWQEMLLDAYRWNESSMRLYANDAPREGMCPHNWMCGHLSVKVCYPGKAGRTPYRVARTLRKFYATRDMDRWEEISDIIFLATNCITASRKFESSWFSSTVVALAQAIQQEDAYDRLPILADALEEAGCDHVDLLDACRTAKFGFYGMKFLNILCGNNEEKNNVSISAYTERGSV